MIDALAALAFAAAIVIDGVLLIVALAPARLVGGV